MLELFNSEKSISVRNYYVCNENENKISILILSFDRLVDEFLESRISEISISNDYDVREYEIKNHFINFGVESGGSLNALHRDQFIIDFEIKK